MVLRARKTAVTCKPLFHQGRGYPKAKQPGSILKKSAVCIGFVVIPQKRNRVALPPCSFFAGSLRDSNPIKSTYGGPDKHLIQVKAHSALTGEATGPKDKQQALFRACLRQQELWNLYKQTRKPGFRISGVPYHTRVRKYTRKMKNGISESCAEWRLSCIAQ